eukprot:6987486-Alexandrium_andersonii.AAC.1
MNAGGRSAGAVRMSVLLASCQSLVVLCSALVLATAGLHSFMVLVERSVRHRRCSCGSSGRGQARGLLPGGA